MLLMKYFLLYITMKIFSDILLNIWVKCENKKLAFKSFFESFWWLSFIIQHLCLSTFPCTSCRIATSFALSSSLFCWRYIVVTGFTEVSLSAFHSVHLSAHLCSSPSFSGVTPVWRYCFDSVPICLSRSECLSVSLSFLLPSPRLMFYKCDRSHVNLYISFFIFLLAVILSSAAVFPCEWCQKWKSCTSQHSRGWTACTCEHKTSGDAVTSSLFSVSVLLFSADVPHILKKKFKKVTPVENFRHHNSKREMGHRNVPEYIWQQSSHKFFSPTVVKSECLCL